MSEDTLPRPGSTQDLLRRMDRMEQRQDNVETEVRTLAATVSRVEQNQTHAAELNKLRFDALETSLNALHAEVGSFIKRIEGMLTGEVETQQAREGRALVEDYKKWREATDARLDDQDVFNGRLSLIGRLAVLLVSSNLLAILAAVYAVVNQ